MEYITDKKETLTVLVLKQKTTKSMKGLRKEYEKTNGDEAKVFIFLEMKNSLGYIVYKYQNTNKGMTSEQKKRISQLLNRKQKSSN